MIDGSDLKQFRLFSDFSDDERDLVAEVLDVRRLRPGKSAFREGDGSEGLVLLVSGRLALKRRGSDLELGILDAPAHLGTGGLFALGAREVTAVALEPATVLILSRGAVPRLVDEAPRAAFRLAEAVARELSGLLRESVAGVTEWAAREASSQNGAHCEGRPEDSVA
jgi:CRP-like cAMP-binding protein